MLILTSQEHGEHMRVQGPRFLLFAAPRLPPDPWKKRRAAAPKGGVQNFRSTFPANGCGGVDSSGLPPLSCPTLRLTTLRRWRVGGWGGEESISGCVCPRLDLRKGGALRDDRERRQHLLSGGAALRHSSAEQRGEELCGRDG